MLLMRLVQEEHLLRNLRRTCTATACRWHCSLFNQHRGSAQRPNLAPYSRRRMQEEDEKEEEVMIRMIMIMTMTMIMIMMRRRRS